MAKKSYEQRMVDLRVFHERAFIGQEGEWEPFTGSVEALADATGPFTLGVREGLLTIVPRLSALFLSREKAAAGDMTGSVMTTTSLLSADNSKVRCPSWCLPAGSPKLGGVCSLAGARHLREKAVAHTQRHAWLQEYVCDGCYALEGNMGFNNNQLRAAQRVAWVGQTLCDETFVDVMVEAIERARRKFRNAEKTRTGDFSIDHFRVHDSGDLAVLDNFYGDWVKGELIYTLAWWEIARRLPEVLFWAPTRDWANAAWLQRAVRLARYKPANFILRPSALYTNEAATALGVLDERLFAAGSSVAWPHIPATSTWTCLAYHDPDPNDPSIGASCVRAKGPDGQRPCRACWEHPELSINYTPHGRVFKTPPEVKAHRRRIRAALKASSPVQANPRYDMDEPRLPHTRLEAFWLTSQVRAAGGEAMSSDFALEVQQAFGSDDAEEITQDDWIDFLSGFAYDGEDISEFLDNLPEV